jgi:hypothetical protein
MSKPNAFTPTQTNPRLTPGPVFIKPQQLSDRTPRDSGLKTSVLKDVAALTIVSPNTGRRIGLDHDKK